MDIRLIVNDVSQSSRRCWEAYAKANEVMLLERKNILWWIVEAVDKKTRQAELIQHVLGEECFTARTVRGRPSAG